ncbi:MAG TPA: aminoacyl-tRNA hydrolase, partial [Anaerolineales bacterium]|nr:aminoacyl-tRNA hydrolase [Anaerolineales bacterium]
MTSLDDLFNALRGIRPEAESSESSVADDSQFTVPYLLVGLGNPGREYSDTRHNVGFMSVDRLAERLGVTFTRTQSKALLTDARYQGVRIYLAKPQTYMNLSGQAVGALVKFYKIPLENLLVLYDDVDLPFDTLRLRPKGGSAGHKGMRSIIQQLGTQEFPRLRLGVGRSFGSRQAADYVLKPFSRQESEFLPAYLD